MASRILTLASCTLYFCLLISLTIIGLASFILGIVGVSLFIPASSTYDMYKSNTCFILDTEYDIYRDSYYYIMWSVEYYISNATSNVYTFSTITQIYDRLNKVLEKLAIYKDRTNQTCYYNKEQVVRVQWNEPLSPRPYLIMLIVGFSLTGIYLIFIVIFCYYRFRHMNSINSSNDGKQ